MQAFAMMDDSCIERVLTPCRRFMKKRIEKDIDSGTRCGTIRMTFFDMKMGELLFPGKCCDGLQTEANATEIDNPSVIPSLKGERVTLGKTRTDNRASRGGYL